MERYSRQILFKHIGKKGQKRLSQKHVFILGCGALGSANAENLVRAGIGKLTIADRDYVELSNLHRQQLYTEKDVAEQMPKAIAAMQKLQEINGSVEIDAHVADVSPNMLSSMLETADLVIDATDNFDARLMLNDICHQRKIPWIFGSCAGSTGMTFTVLPGETPCLQCLLDSVPVSGATCDSVGVIVSAVQMVVAHQTAEALKILVEDYDHLRTRFVAFDVWNNMYQQWNVKRAKKDSCPTCGNHPVYPALKAAGETKTEILCGRNTVQIRSKKHLNLDLLAERLQEMGKVIKNEYLLSVEYESYRLVFFQDGRTLIHGTDSVEKAKSIYHQVAG